MNNVSNQDRFDQYNTHVFEAYLPRTQKAELWKLEKNEDTERLQNLFDLATENRNNPELCSKYINEYQADLDDLQSAGKRTFTLTKGVVSELTEDPNHKTMQVPIKMQVKEGVLTWYFEAPMDQTKQSFRDEVFLSAGLAQVGVDDSRFRYLRGTNSLHVKKMHTHENEAMLNHNHYVLDEGVDFDPKHFKQHLDGFVKAERELAQEGYIKDAGKEVGQEKFLTQEEADALVKEYTAHWEKINAKPVEPKDAKSELESLKESGKRRMTMADKHENVKYQVLFNTVTSEGSFKKVEEGKGSLGSLRRQKDSQATKTSKNIEELPESKTNLRESKTFIRKKAHFTIDPNWPLNQRIDSVKKAMRGGYSNRAQVRQMDDSKLHAMAEIKEMNDAVEIDQKKTVK